MPVYGFTQSLVFFIAQNTAARQDARVREGVRQARSIMLLYALAVTAGCILFARPMLRLFTSDGGAIAYGALLLSRQAIVYAFTAMKHFQEASLRGRQQMGLYLASNLGGTALDLLALRPAGAPVGVQRLLPRQFRQRAGRLFAGGGAGPRRGPAGRGPDGRSFSFFAPCSKGAACRCA